MRGSLLSERAMDYDEISHQFLQLLCVEGGGGHQDVGSQYLDEVNLACNELGFQEPLRTEGEGEGGGLPVHVVFAAYLS